MLVRCFLLRNDEIDRYKLRRRGLLMGDRDRGNEEGEAVLGHV